MSWQPTKVVFLVAYLLRHSRHKPEQGSVVSKGLKISTSSYFVRWWRLFSLHFQKSSLAVMGFNIINIGKETTEIKSYCSGL